MRDTSIISIIRRYGLNSKKLSVDSRVKFRDTLNSLSLYRNNDLELTNVVDNEANPELSLSNKCLVQGCGKRIRFEYHLYDKNNNLIVCGSNCCCTLLGLSKLQQKSFKSIEAALKEKKELDDYRKNNPDIVRKLEKLKEYNLPFYKPFCDEIAVSALTDEDTEFIRKLNMKLVISDLKHLDILKDLIKYDPNKEIYKSIRDHVLVKGRYLSGKQREFVEKEYEMLQKKKNETIIVVSNGYDFREYLKTNGYMFNAKEKEWSRIVSIKAAEQEQKKLTDIGVNPDAIQKRKATW